MQISANLAYFLEPQAVNCETVVIKVYLFFLTHGIMLLFWGDKYAIFPNTVLQLILIDFTQRVLGSKNMGVYVSVDCTSIVSF